MRPLVWLFIFAAGFRQMLGVSIIPPYDTYVLYEVYITPGLMAMIQLFNGMQSSLSMVYDREMGTMRMLLVSPLPRWFLLTAQAARRRRGVDPAGLRLSRDRLFLGDRAAELGLSHRPAGAGARGLMLGALGMLLSSLIKQLENFAGVMNFVIFPMFFASSALYPLWRVREGSPWLALALRDQPVHPRRRVDPLRVLRPGRADLAGRRRRLHGGFSGGRDLGLRPGARHFDAQGGMR